MNFERLIIGAETFPFDVAYRAAIGFLTLPMVSRLAGEDHDDWLLVPFLLGVFLVLRVVPAVVRKLIRFSPEAQRIWAQRRLLAKRYDSYQWRKLFWIGVGLGACAVISGRLSAGTILVTLVCLTSGMLGVVRWRIVAARIYGSQVSVKQEARRA